MLKKWLSTILGDLDPKRVVVALIGAAVVVLSLVPQFDAIKREMQVGGFGIFMWAVKFWADRLPPKAP